MFTPLTLSDPQVKSAERGVNGAADTALAVHATSRFRNNIMS
jgi:hypothetical protein